MYKADNLTEKLLLLSGVICKVFDTKSDMCDYKKAISFENDTFYIKPYKKDQGDNEYNFFYKPLGLGLCWYKTIDEKLVISERISEKEFSQIVEDCIDSLSDIINNVFKIADITEEDIKEITNGSK